MPAIKLLSCDLPAADLLVDAVPHRLLQGGIGRVFLGLHIEDEACTGSRSRPGARGRGLEQRAETESIHRCENWAWLVLLLVQAFGESRRHSRHSRPRRCSRRGCGARVRRRSSWLRACWRHRCHRGRSPRPSHATWLVGPRSRSSAMLAKLSCLSPCMAARSPSTRVAADRQIKVAVCFMPARPDHLPSRSPRRSSPATQSTSCRCRFSR